MPTDLSKLKVAIVHDWLVSARGGERVLDSICEVFPQAEVFTLFHRPGHNTDRIEGKCLCPLGDACAMPVRSYLKHFREEFEACIGVGVMCMAAAFIGRDTWVYSVVAVIAGTVLMLFGAIANRKYLKDAVGNRGALRRRG